MKNNLINIIFYQYPNHILCLLGLFLFANIRIYSQEDLTESSIADSIQVVPNSLSFGIDKQINIYAYNFLLNYSSESSAGNFYLNQKYFGTTYSAGMKIFQDEEDLQWTYDYPLGQLFSALASSDFMLVSNRGSNELNELKRLNFLAGARINPISKLNLDFLAGAEDNNQMGILSTGSIFKVKGTLHEIDISGYKFSGLLNSELLSLSYDRTSRTMNFLGFVNKQYDVNDMISANVAYKVMDRFNAFRRDPLYMESNALDFAYSLESRSNNMLLSDLNFSFGLTEKLVGLVRLSFSQNNIERFFKEYVPKDSKTGIRQYRNQLKLAINPELTFKSNILQQLLGFWYSFESDENRIHNANNISDIEFNIMRSRVNELDNLTSIFRIVSKTNLNITTSDTLSFSGMASTTRFDTPSEANNSDRDEFLGLFSLNYARAFSENVKFGLNAEAQFNHQVNLRASRSASNFWMRSIKFAPSVTIQTKTFFMRPQPYILANYTVYDFEGFAPGVRSFSLRQIGYNDSISVIIGENLYLGTRFDLIYKETGTLFWSDFKEQPINGNLKLFFKFYTGYFDDRFNVALGARYFNLTQQTFRTSVYVNSDYKTESFAPEIIVSAVFFSGATFRLNGWYEFQIINDTYKNEIPNIILNTSIKL